MTTGPASKGLLTATATFAVTVEEQVLGGLVGTYSFEGDLAESTGALTGATVTGGRIDAPGGTVGYVPGVRGQAVLLDGASGVRLPDGLIAGATYSVSLWVRPDALTQYTTLFFGARDTNAWVSVVPNGHDGVGGNTMVWCSRSA